MSHHINLTRIKSVSNALGELKDRVVFVGAATVSLYADRMAVEIRPTDDVDVLVEISTRIEFAVLEEQLRNKGFQIDKTSKFVGRYTLPGVIVDIMPTDESILGFSNKWYLEGFKSAVEYKIDDLHTVKILAPAYFIASKIEAFKNRGKNDGRTSDDFEDIVFVFENRRTIWREMSDSDHQLKTYLLNEINKLYANRYIQEWIDAHSSFHSPPSSYIIMKDMENFLKGNKA
jgi:predicted nucleotidyltransferase